MSIEKISAIFAMDDCLGNYNCGKCDRFIEYSKKVQYLKEDTRFLVMDVVGNKLFPLSMFHSMGRLGEIQERIGDCKKYAGFIIIHTKDDIEAILGGEEPGNGTAENMEKFKERVRIYIKEHLKEGADMF